MNNDEMIAFVIEELKELSLLAKETLSYLLSDSKESEKTLLLHEKHMQLL